MANKCIKIFLDDQPRQSWVINLLDETSWQNMVRQHGTRSEAGVRTSQFASARLLAIVPTRKRQHIDRLIYQRLMVSPYIDPADEARASLQNGL
jgi:hypothetical protein